MGFFINIRGLVQGVGFRPFVFNLAQKMGVKGEVYNDSSGVKIRLDCDQILCDEFIGRLKNELPPLSRIDDIDIQKADFSFNDFRIVRSAGGDKAAPILPDFAICEACKKEFYDPLNRRYLHPFINCTDCGPRFSIIAALPYDRANTTMSGFEMCEKCEKEYSDPLNRRYHAQPVCCAECGPKISLKDRFNNILATSNKAAKIAAQKLKDGDIIAVKGLGGFHLMCDATNAKAIDKLRKHKNRPSKPFAVMIKDLDMAKKIAHISQSEADALNSAIKPIILLNSVATSLVFLNGIAPNLDKIGVFIAPTALNLLIFEYFNRPLIATSANISGEPIIKDFAELSAINHIFDAVIDHDRAILRPSDDSVGFVLNKRIFWIRTSRGLKPRFSVSPSPFEAQNSDNGLKQTPSQLWAPKNAILALGSELKNQFAIYNNGQIISSPYIGDLKNMATKNRFYEAAKLLSATYDIKINHAIGDLHPHFELVKEAKNGGVKTEQIQHHKAHILSVCAEFNICDEVLGFSFDGTGYGENGDIWGGEVFRGSVKTGFKRILYFEDFGLIGGDSAIKNINFLAFAVLKKCGFLDNEVATELAKMEQNMLSLLPLKGEIASQKISAFLNRLGSEKISNLNKLEKSAMKTSSLGRLFDAFACLVLGIDKISFDAEAAMRLEAFYDEDLELIYPFKINHNIIKYAFVFEMGLAAKSPKEAATGFINGVADLIINIANSVATKKIVLGGGCFQNAALLKRIFKIKGDLEIFVSQNEPLNDGNIALGQLFWAINHIKD